MAEKNIRLHILSHLIAAAAGSALTFAFVVKAPEPEAASQRPTAPKPSPAVKEPESPIIPLPPPPLDRSALLSAAAAAADAIAGGSALPRSNADLLGRSFVLRLPFGCRGEKRDGEKSWAGWVFNPKSRALRLSARTSDLGQADWMKELAGEMTFDAVEGFWIARPWTRADQCADLKKQTAGAMATALSEQLAIAQFFSPEGSRTLRRGERPYSSTVKLTEDEAPSAAGYQMQLEGRLTGFPDGQPVHCVQHDSDLPPRCVIAVEFERVAFIAPGKDQPLVEWR